MAITVSSRLGSRRAAPWLVPARAGACAGVCHCSPGVCMQPSGTLCPQPRWQLPWDVPVPTCGSSAGCWLSPAPCPAPPTVSRLQTSCNLGLKISKGEGGELVARPEQGWAQVRGYASPGTAAGGVSQPGCRGPSLALGSLQTSARSCRNDVEMQQILLIVLVPLPPHTSGTSGVSPLPCHPRGPPGLTQPSLLPASLSSHRHLWGA